MNTIKTSPFLTHQDRINNVKRGEDPIYEIFQRSNQFETDFCSTQSRLESRVKEPSSQLEQLIIDLQNFFETTISSENEYIQAFDSRMDEIESVLSSLEKIFEEPKEESSLESEEISEDPMLHFTLQSRALLEGIDLFPLLLDFSIRASTLREQLEQLYKESAPIKKEPQTESSFTHFSTLFSSKATSLPEEKIQGKSKQFTEEQRENILSFINFLKITEREFDLCFPMSDVIKLSSVSIGEAKPFLAQLEKIEKHCQKEGFIQPIYEDTTTSETRTSSTESELALENNFREAVAKHSQLQAKVYNLSIQKIPEKYSLMEDYLKSKLKEIVKLLRKEKQTFDAELTKFHDKKKECASLLKDAEKAIPSKPPAAPAVIDSHSTSSLSEEPSIQANTQQDRLLGFTNQAISVPKIRKSGFPRINPISNLRTKAANLLTQTSDTIEQGRKTLFQGIKSTLTTPLEIAIEHARRELEELEFNYTLTDERFFKIEATLSTLACFIEKDPSLKNDLRLLFSRFSTAKDLFTNRFLSEIHSKKELKEELAAKKEKLHHCNESLKDVEEMIRELQGKATSLQTFIEQHQDPITLQQFNEHLTELIKTSALSDKRFQNAAHFINKYFKETEKTDFTDRLKKSFKFFKDGKDPITVLIIGQDPKSLIKTKKERLFFSLQEVLLIEKELEQTFLTEATLEIESTLETLTLKFDTWEKTITLLMTTHSSCLEEETFRDTLPRLNDIKRELIELQKEKKEFQNFKSYLEKIKNLEESIQGIETEITDFMHENQEEIESAEKSEELVLRLKEFYSLTS